MTDLGKWKFRPPPHGVARESLVLCRTVQRGEPCRMGVHCVAAHREEELAEWREQWEERNKPKEGLDGDTMSYSEKILDEVLNADRSTPMAESLSGVSVTCDQDTTIKFSCRNSSTVWNFSLLSQRLLKGVTLLGVENLQHFAIANVSRVNVSSKGKVSFKTQDQECIIEEEEEKKKTADEISHLLFEYNLKLKFHTKIFGTFKQTVVFDFGIRPLLFKTVVADVVPVSSDTDLQYVKESITVISDVWDSSNSDLVSFDPAPPRVHADEKELLEKYPAPQPSKFEMSEAVLEPTLTMANYRERMHQLLYIEELSQFSAVEGFNALIKLQLASRYLMSASPSNSSTAKYARPGELFGRIELHSELSEDTAAGRLILLKCNSILLKFETGVTETKKKKKDKKVKLNKKKIWECLIEDTAKSVIYIRLSSGMVKENKLTADMRIRAEVQFKLSRISMVEMHYAIDKISELSTVHPDVEALPKIPWNPTTQWEHLDSNLNPKQKEAIIAITSPVDLKLPPILIIGPYGTGKTYALGKAIKQLIMEDSAKILVCTHSNSAADLYIREYLDPAISEGKLKKSLLRVYYHNRWVQTVHSSVQKYCLIDTDPITSTRRFKPPTVEDLANKDVVVATLSTSRSVAELLPVGHFTHILIDEAAQAMETEAIIPLVLANKNTRVVLAGDHMQLEPNITSDFALEKRLNITLLERLYDLYPADFPCKILLCENYRSHESIVSYTSELFYEQKVVASGKQPAHQSWFPLTFFTARGEDVQDPNSTSFYNNSEVYEIVDRLSELKRNWPKAWGRKEETEIGVVTPYQDQVMRIRAELRKKKLYNISVERVQNVQGKQYRAIFISTVRTRGTCFKTDDNDMKTLDYGFLSSAKLLNTAITRAQSLVAVVGDPVALSSVGKCRKLWEHFLKICKVKESLYGFTWNELKSHLQAIELKKIYGLNPLAPEFVPRFAAPGKTEEDSKNISVPHIPMGTLGPHQMPYLGIVPPQFLNKPMSKSVNPFFNPPPIPSPLSPTPYLPITPRGMPFLPQYPPLPPPWARPQLPPLTSSPIPPAFLMRPPLRHVDPSQSFPIPIVSRPSFDMFPFFPPFPPDIPSTNPYLNLSRQQVSFGGPAMHSAGMTVATSEAANKETSTSAPAQIASNFTNRDQPPQLEHDNILPRGLDLTTMLNSPELQQAWHSHLVATGQLKEAEAFQILIGNNSSLLKPTSVVETQETDNILCSGDAPDTDTPLSSRPAVIHSPDSGCFSSPPDGSKLTASQRDNSLSDVFESLLTDFESSWNSPEPSNTESVPLYLRRGHTLEPDTSDHHLLFDTFKSSPGPTSQLPHMPDSEVARLPTQDMSQEVRQLPPVSFPNFDTSFLNSLGQVTSEPPVQTYAGVVRTPPKKTEQTDPLIKIRNLGTMGSHL